ncbi:hypothetical protein EXN66_Car021264 [Channa argus]|uniref:Uncharacterized protein n=1 Tax=Channa argus TaxID=215402 RepID=A0A6G1QTF0_CHAAH|nr:hypothetical protein EXN66_Car021264 [Channa argus]
MRMLSIYLRTNFKTPELQSETDSHIVSWCSEVIPVISSRSLDQMLPNVGDNMTKAFVVENVVLIEFFP